MFMGSNANSEEKLIRCIQKSDIDEINRFIQSGVSLDFEFEYEGRVWTPLKYAVAIDYPNAFRTLLRGGADPSLPRDDTSAQELAKELNFADMLYEIELLEQRQNLI